MENTRTLTLPERLVILFSGFESQFGWLFFGFGMSFAWIFGMLSPLPDLFIRHDGTTTGIILAENSTSTSYVNGNEEQAYTYTYTMEGKKYEKTGHARPAAFQGGEQVTVRYSTEKPFRSKVKGLRNAPFPWITAVVFIFPLVGLLFIAFSLRINFKRLDLLRQGIFARGKRISKEPTQVTINKQTVYEYTFSFTANDGKSYQAKGSTHLTDLLEDEETERILYASTDPTYSVVYDTIANAPTLGTDGNFNPLPPSRYLVLVIPALSILVHGYVTFLLLNIL